jgi:hypothetical protein
MNDRRKRGLRWALAGSTLAPACLVGLLAYRYRGNSITSPLTTSPFLRDVAEPIAMIKGSYVAGSDDHWMGVTFKDAKQVERQVKYIYYWPPVGDHPGYQRKLLLGREVPPGGAEERAFLGLLQRWYRGDDEIRQLWARVERDDPALARTPWGWDGLTDQQSGKIVAVTIMKVLQGRN